MLYNHKQHKKLVCSLTILEASEKHQYNAGAFLYYDTNYSKHKD